MVTKLATELLPSFPHLSQMSTIGDMRALVAAVEGPGAGEAKKLLR